MRVTKKLKTGDVRVYKSWRALIPEKIITSLHISPSTEQVILVAQLEQARWWHTIKWDTRTLKKMWDLLPEEAKLDLCAKEMVPSEACGGLVPITVLVPHEVRESLGSITTYDKLCKTSMYHT